jgi:hypothetical protein
MGCIIGGFGIMFGVTAAVFLLLNMIFPWWLAGVIAMAFLYGWYKLNQRSALRGSSRAILGAYFRSRKNGGSHADSLRNAIVTRYFSEARREELLGRYMKVVRTQPVVTEKEQVRTLVRILHWEEVGIPPVSALEVAAEHERNLNEEISRAESKYGITLNDSGPPRDGSLTVEPRVVPTGRPNDNAVIIRCRECGQRMRVPRGKGKIRVRCSTCGERGDHTS